MINQPNDIPGPAATHTRRGGEPPPPTSDNRRPGPRDATTTGSGMQGPVIDPTSSELDRDRLYNALKSTSLAALRGISIRVIQPASPAVPRTP